MIEEKVFHFKSSAIRAAAYHNRWFYMTGTHDTLILIHGATLNGRMWDALRRDLDPRYHVLTPDLPGHGGRRDEIFTLQGAIDTVLAAAKSVPDSPIILAGDSLGGYTAMACAASMPSRQLKALVLCGCSSNLQGLALLPYLFTSTTLRLLIAWRGEDRLLAATAPKLVSDFKMRQADADNLLHAGINLKVFPQAVNALRGVDFRATLAAIEQPVLIVNGGRDRGHIRQEPSFVAAARQVTTHRIADCKHGVTVRRAPQCAAVMNAFAARIFAL
jgi:pimeloyl-ACP methyl ester carboxylesterase